MKTALALLLLFFLTSCAIAQDSTKTEVDSLAIFAQQKQNLARQFDSQEAEIIAAQSKIYALGKVIEERKKIQGDISLQHMAVQVEEKSYLLKLEKQKADSTGTK